MNTKEKVMKVVRDPKAQIGLSLAVATLCLVTPQVSKSDCNSGDENDCNMVKVGPSHYEPACVQENDFWFDDCA